MLRKSYFTILLTIAFIFFCLNFVFANNMEGVANGIRNTIQNTENTVENAAKDISNTSKNITSGMENGAENVKDSIMGNNSTDTNNNNNEQRDMVGTTNSDYTASRTSTTQNGDTGLLGLDSTTWIWIIMALVAVAIITLVYYYYTGVDSKHGYTNSGDE